MIRGNGSDPPLKVWIHEGTWCDRKWKKELSKLPHQEQRRIENNLRQLIRDLKDANHPVLAPTLRRWSPKPYHGRRGLELYEYRLKDRNNKARAVVSHRTAKGQPAEVALVACTVTHDNDRIDALIRNYARSASE